MHLTRTGYNVLVAVWLAPLILADFIGNTLYSGPSGSYGARMSDYFYYKMMADGLLMAYAVWTIVSAAPTASLSNAKARQNDRADEVVGFESLGAWEYIYCLLLVIYGGVNWYSLHTLNQQASGLISVATALWSFVSIAVAILSAVQFYHLKSGVIVELKHKIVQ